MKIIILGSLFQFYINNACNYFTIKSIIKENSLMHSLLTVKKEKYSKTEKIFYISYVAIISLI